MGKADESVEIYVNGAEVATGNPLPVSPVAGGAGGLTDAELRASAVPVSVAAGADATTGNTTDAAVDTDTTGTVSGKLRGLVKLLINLLSRWPAALGAGGGLKVDGSGTALPVSGTVTANLQPVTTGGSTPYRNLDLGVTGQVVKNGAGQLYGYYLYNNASSVRFVKFYDKGTAPSEADTPVWTLAIPAASAANVAFPNGVAFAAGISLRATTAIADNSTAAPSTNDVVVNLAYK